MRLAVALALVVAPTALAVEPGGPEFFEPWIRAGEVNVELIDASTATVLCDDTQLATLYSWERWDSANFQLALPSGCAPAALFHGVGNAWSGWALDAFFAGGVPTRGSISGEEAGSRNTLAMEQDLGQGIVARYSGALDIWW